MVVLGGSAVSYERGTPVVATGAGAGFGVLVGAGGGERHSCRVLFSSTSRVLGCSFPASPRGFATVPAPPPAPPVVAAAVVDAVVAAAVAAGVETGAGAGVEVGALVAPAATTASTGGGAWGGAGVGLLVAPALVGACAACARRFLMSEVPLHTLRGGGAACARGETILWGWAFLMGEVPLYGSAMRLMTDDKRPHPYRGTSLIRNSHPLGSP